MSLKINCCRRFVYGDMLCSKRDVQYGRTKRPKIETSILVRFYPPFFWVAKSTLFIEYIDKRRTIKSEYFIALLMILKEEIARKNYPNWRRKKCSFTNTIHRSEVVGIASPLTLFSAIWLPSTTTSLQLYK